MDLKPPNQEDLVFSDWIKAEGAEREKLERQLVTLISRHARAVCYQRLSEVPSEVVNLAVFLALKNAKSFRGEAKFSTWFQTIVTNLCNRRLLKQMRLKETPLEDLEHELSKSADSVDKRLELEKMSSRLTEYEQKIFWWKYEGHTEEEIAKLLGTSRVQISAKWLLIRRKLGGYKPKPKGVGDAVCGGDTDSVDGKAAEET